MRFSTIFTVLTASAMAFAGVISQISVKRSITDVQEVCDDFITMADVFHFEIMSCQCSNDTCSVITIEQLVNTINDCSIALNTLPEGSLSANDTFAETATSTVDVSLGGLLRSDALHSHTFSVNLGGSRGARDQV